MAKKTTEYLCVTLISRHAEAVSAITARLSTFWTAILRSQPDLFEKVYAETTSYELEGASWTRRYLVEAEAVSDLEIVLRENGIDFQAIDREDVYSCYEASTPEWMQIEH